MSSPRSEDERRASGILFIDELHTIVGAGAAEARSTPRTCSSRCLRAASCAALARRPWMSIASISRKTPPWSGGSRPVLVGEPTVADTIGILRGLKERYEDPSRRAHPRRGARRRRGVVEPLHRRSVPPGQGDRPGRRGAASRLRMEIDSSPLEGSTRRTGESCSSRSSSRRWRRSRRKCAIPLEPAHRRGEEGPGCSLAARWAKEKEALEERIKAATSRLDELQDGGRARRAGREPAAGRGDSLRRDSRRSSASSTESQRARGARWSRRRSTRTTSPPSSPAGPASRSIGCSKARPRS